MNDKSELLDILDLKPGMVVYEDIVLNGTTLIGKGVTLTENMLDKIKSLYQFNKVEILTDEEPSQENIEMEEAKKTLQSATKNIESIFISTSNINSHTTREINDYAKKLLHQVKINTNMIKSIILTGSGEDAIYTHSINVAILSYLLGRWSNLPENQLQSLISAALFHDFGKTKIDEKILNKPGKLTSKEYEVIKTHPILAYNELKEVPFMNKSILYGVLMHHERCDGSGYPLGLTSEQIDIFAKIIAIADTFDAINSNRVYKERVKPLTALKIIKEESLKKLDYPLCCTFLKGLESYYIGQYGLLSNNSTCKILQLNHNDLEAPLVFCDDEFIDLSKNRDLSIVKLL